MAMVQLTQIINLEARVKREKLTYRITIQRDAIKRRHSNEPRANSEKMNGQPNKT